MSAAALNDRTQSIGNRLRRFSSKYTHPHSFRAASGNSSTSNPYPTSDNTPPNANATSPTTTTTTTTTTASSPNTPTATVRSGRTRRRRSSFFGTLSLSHTNNDHDPAGPQHPSSEPDDGGPLTTINTSPGHLSASNPLQTGIGIIRSMSRSRSRRGPRRARDAHRAAPALASSSSSQASDRHVDSSEETNNLGDLGSSTTPAALPSATMASEIDREVNERLTEMSLHPQSDGQSPPQSHTEDDQQRQSPQEQSSSSNTPVTEAAVVPPKPNNNKATIRFFPYQDPHNPSRPSLSFTTISRTVTEDDALICVGRYSERESKDTGIHAVGFKSKVVSRKHCEFSRSQDAWFVRDVGSSSGTFLNHIRLSQPNVESKPYPVRDGDLIQLGIDFRGGEEMIFRCVRMRIECNRMWQKKANRFNKNTAALISNLSKNTAESEGCRECSICLGSIIRPYQNLFMASCAHVWHYKCISRLLHGSSYPLFQCPNCRAWSDLASDPDDYIEDSATEDADDEEGEKEAGEQGQPPKEEHEEHGNPEASHATENAAATPHHPLGTESRTTTDLVPEVASLPHSIPESPPPTAPQPESRGSNELGLIGVLLDAHSDRDTDRREYTSSEVSDSDQNDTQPSSAGRGSSDLTADASRPQSAANPVLSAPRPCSRPRPGVQPLDQNLFDTMTPSNDLGALACDSTSRPTSEAPPTVSAS